MRIVWQETINKMREKGYSEKEITSMKKHPAETICRFLDQGREIILFVKHKGIILQMLGLAVKGKAGFKPARPE